MLIRLGGACFLVGVGRKAANDGIFSRYFGGYVEDPLDRRLDCRRSRKEVSICCEAPSLGRVIVILIAHFAPPVLPRGPRCKVQIAIENNGYGHRAQMFSHYA